MYDNIIEVKRANPFHYNDRLCWYFTPGKVPEWIYRAGTRGVYDSFNSLKGQNVLVDNELYKISYYWMGAHGYPSLFMARSITTGKVTEFRIGGNSHRIVVEDYLSRKNIEFLEVNEKPSE
jgi:hypothetical protein